MVPTTEKMVKEVINNMETYKLQSSQTKKDKYISNESNKGMALDKSRSLGKSRAYQRTEIQDTVKPLKKVLFHQPVYLIKVPKYNNQKK